MIKCSVIVEKYIDLMLKYILCTREIKNEKGQKIFKKHKRFN